MEDIEKLNEIAIKQLKELLSSTDAESNHIYADSILCELLSAHGHDEVVELFESLEKWYC